MILPVASLLVSAAFASSIYSFIKQRTIWRLLQLFGAICLIVVALTHAAERYDVLPGMGWGESDSAGHYLDLVSAILGCTLLPVGFGAGAVTRRWEADQGAVHGRS